MDPDRTVVPVQEFPAAFRGGYLVVLFTSSSADSGTNSRQSGQGGQGGQVGHGGSPGMSGSSGKRSAKAKGVNGILLMDETTQKFVKRRQHRRPSNPD
jgi:hypothetical protein